jgi:hypothetical protein
VGHRASQHALKECFGVGGDLLFVRHGHTPFVGSHNIGPLALYGQEVFSS